MDLKEKLKKVVPLALHEFTNFEGARIPGTHVFEDYDECETWFEDFRDCIFLSITERTFLPVFRMSHGEFHFALGTRLNPELNLRGKLFAYYKMFKEKLGVGAYLNEYSPQAGTRELLSKAEYHQVYDKVVDDLGWIAQRGIICACFHRTPGYIEYMPEIYDWLDANKILLNRRNYFHFYFVYALLFGESQEDLFGNKNVLVVTSFPGDKKERLSRALSDKGVKQFSTIEIASSRSLFEKISTHDLDAQPDLVLVGAGVGSTNIIRQLGDLKCPVMDVGFGIDAIADPDMRWRRPFCIKSSERKEDRICYRPAYDLSKYEVREPYTVKW